MSCAPEKEATKAAELAARFGDKKPKRGREDEDDKAGGGGGQRARR